MSKKQFIFVLICTFIVVVIWVIADLIHTKPSVPLNPKLETLLDQINPQFDQAVLEQVKNGPSTNSVKK